MSSLSNQLVERFFRYVAVSSQSDAICSHIPSSTGQTQLAKLLVTELEELGLHHVLLDANGIVTAYRPGNTPNAPKVGFVAHLDTVDVGLSPDIRPQIQTFTGADICLNPSLGIWLRVAEHPEILPYEEQEIIFSDGTSVLGADNKAAIAVIMTLLAVQKESSTPVGDIYIAFVPDEEIGLRGSKALDLALFPVDFAYTIDCTQLGEVVYQTFNAAAAYIEINGVTAHPMSAKGVLVNPIRVAHDLIGCFDRYDTPEHTAGKEGYFWFTDMAANPAQARLTMAIRDFDRSAFEQRKQYIHEAVELIRSRHPKATITCRIDDVYENISNNIDENGHPSIELIFQAMHDLHITPKILAMRGGTDGSALSARGLITPNYFTGAHNFHSCFEFLPIPSFVKAYELTERICQLAAAQSPAM